MPLYRTRPNLPALLLRAPSAARELKLHFQITMKLKSSFKKIKHLNKTRTTINLILFVSFQQNGVGECFDHPRSTTSCSYSQCAQEHRYYKKVQLFSSQLIGTNFVKKQPSCERHLLIDSGFAKRLSGKIATNHGSSSSRMISP